MRIATSYLRADLFADTRMAEPEFVRPSLQAALQDLGYSFGHAEEVFTARPAAEWERTTMELEVGEWVGQVVRRSTARRHAGPHAGDDRAATVTSSPIGQVAGADEF